MSEHSQHQGDHEPERYDAEIDIPGIVKTGFWLAATVVLSFILMWWMSTALKRVDDPRATRSTSPLPEAATRQLPPFPRLQAKPEAELAALHAEEARILESYGWVDKGQGIARIPLEEALEIVGSRGTLPVMPAPAATAPAAGAAQ
ncbi:MAG TPA: hypothetical protein VF017_08000 [Thermoanaerobaculia bacterium]|nr:hypothetical protein [Thermoanaerobaculia bacterium]